MATISNALLYGNGVVVCDLLPLTVGYIRSTLTQNFKLNTNLNRVLRIYLVINSFNMKMTKKDIKYIVKLFIAYPTSLIFGIIGYRKGFDKMIIWLNKDV
jgi:hypothetical protein